MKGDNILGFTGKKTEHKNNQVPKIPTQHFVKSPKVKKFRTTRGGTGAYPLASSVIYKNLGKTRLKIELPGM